MKKFIIAILIIIAGYQAWQMYQKRSARLGSLYDEPYLIVYGRDSCGWTQKYLRTLKDEGVACIYENVDKPGVGDELHPRMREAGLNTRRYLLPVIEVNGKMFIRPKLAKIIAAYSANSEAE